MNQRAVFVSDLHLIGDEIGNHDPKTQRFVRFLDSLHTSSPPVSHLFLVGDVFDLWVSDHRYFIDRFSDVVRAIRALIRAGVEVHYFEGNHDLHLEDFWARNVGAKVHPDDSTFYLCGFTVRVEHGDLINPDDHGYLILRKALRSLPMAVLAQKLPERLVQWIGQRASRASRDYTSNAKSKPIEQIRKLIRQHAETVSQKNNFDLIITGHVHVADDFKFDVGGRQVRSINLGSWYEHPPRAFVLDATGGRFEPIP